jgi:hypothetical protein
MADIWLVVGLSTAVVGSGTTVLKFYVEDLRAYSPITENGARTS